ncbi:iron chelate uptake ABC transporter family permease subunit [bacterium]|nr:iron chelate uptake ABC transporter family permease subunit [bacterium]
MELTQKVNLRNTKIVIPVLFILLLASILISLMTGEIKGWNEMVILHIRLPRALLGLIVGIALATAGSVYQGLLRNPLADPYILGTSSAGTFGALVAAILNYHFNITVYIFSIGAAFLSMLLVYRIASVQGRTPVQTLILAGVISSTFFGALVLLLFTLFRRESFSILFFLLGSLSGAGSNLLIVISAVLVLIGFSVSMYLARDLDAMSSGEEDAIHLGIPVERVKQLLFFSSSLLVGASVSLAGSIGFVGLIIPHVLRLIVGPSHRKLIPASAIGGAFFLILMDVLARTVFSPLEMPVGVFTSLCGAPFFIYLLKRKQEEMTF